MPVDYQVRWVRGSSSFNILDPYDVEMFEQEEVRYRIPSADALGTDGEYQEDAFADPRTITLSGTIITTSTADALRTLWDTMTAALAGGTEGQLYKSSDRYINGRVYSLVRGKDEGLNYLTWSLTLRCADPWWYASTTNSFTLSVGTTALAAGGTYPAIGVFSFQVSSIGASGTFTLTNSTTGQTFTITPSATGLYVVDCTAGTVTYNGSTDAVSQFSGSFFDQGMPIASSNYVLSTTGGLTISGASVTWRRRYTYA